MASSSNPTNLNINQSSSKSQADCPICGERSLPATLHPCGHTPICVPCVGRLEQKKCPFCRCEIESAVALCLGKEIKWDIDSLKLLTQRNDHMMKRLTKQVLLIGPNESKKEILQQKFVQELRIQDTTMLRSPFRPNSKIGGVSLNFKVGGGRYPYDWESWEEEMEPLDPDFIVLCLPPPISIETAKTGQDWVDFLMAVGPIYRFSWCSVLCQTIGTDSNEQERQNKIKLYDAGIYEDVVQLLFSQQRTNIESALEPNKLSFEELLAIILKRVTLSI